MLRICFDIASMLAWFNGRNSQSCCAKNLIRATFGFICRLCHAISALQGFTESLGLKQAGASTARTTLTASAVATTIATIVIATSFVLRDMAPKHCKRKIGDLTRAKHASQSAIAALLLDIKQHGLPEAFSRGSQYRSRREEATATTPYGPVVTSVRLPLLDRTEIDCHVQHPMAMFWLACRQSRGFSKLVRRALETHVCSKEEPWRIAIYSDEVGVAKLKTDLRKVEAMYWTLLELLIGEG